MKSSIVATVYLALCLTRTTSAHGTYRRIARQATSISRAFTGAPYPTGPGFDVPALAQITQNSPPEPAVPLPTTFPAGSVPKDLGTSATGLPDISNFDPSVYPPLDKLPPTDSPEVKAWLAEIAGADIPNFKPTLGGACDLDPAAAADAGENGRCWWTCGGCVRSTDVVGCPDKSRWGATWDDGPTPSTAKLLTYLQSIDTLGSFYLVGSRVISNPVTVQTQLMIGHELAVHTWSHPSLTTLTNEQIVAELGWCRKAIKDVTGVTPLTFRPPFGDIDDRVRAIANAMNLTPVIWSSVGSGKADTEDYMVPSGEKTAPDTVNQFRNTLRVVEDGSDTGIITLEHDLFQETVDLAIGFHLPDALSRPGPDQRGWKLGTVAQCRGIPASDSYQETTTNQTVLARLGRAPPAQVSTNPGPQTTQSAARGSTSSTSESSSVGPDSSNTPTSTATPASPTSLDSSITTSVTSADSLIDLTPPSVSQASSADSPSYSSASGAQTSNPENEYSSPVAYPTAAQVVTSSQPANIVTSTYTSDAERQSITTILGEVDPLGQSLLAPPTSTDAEAARVNTTPSSATGSATASSGSADSFGYNIKSSASTHHVGMATAALLPLAVLVLTVV